MKACPSTYRLGIVILAVALGLLPFPATATQLVSQAAGPLAGGNHSNGDSGPSILSADGRYVLFSSAANNLVAPDGTNPIPLLIPARMNVYLRDRTTHLTSLVSVNVAGLGGNGDSLAMGISSNGQYAVFESSASDLVASDTNNANDIFVRDIVNGTTTLVSVSTNGLVGNGTSRTPVMTPDGRYVAFRELRQKSGAGGYQQHSRYLCPRSAIRHHRPRQSGRTDHRPHRRRRAAAISVSAAPNITPDGRYVAFYSTATNLVPE